MPRKTGILLVNLGTPEATSYWPMRRYLREFLSDPRVIEAKGPLWWLIFNGIILTRRPAKSGRAYAKIWNTDRNESPLRTITRAQAEQVAARFGPDQSIVVDWAMRYGSPTIAERLDGLRAAGCERSLLFPLYPQYSSATTGSVMDKTHDAFRTMRHQPEFRSVPPYFEHPAYITALSDSIRRHHASLNWAPQLTIASFHGLPQSFVDRGDPYQAHCERTVQLLRQALGADTDSLKLSYQSRAGRAVWLPPDTEELLVKLAQDGVENLTVVTPGFAADCVETLEEIRLRAADRFLRHGGRNFSTVPCLNDSSGSVDMLCALIDRQLEGWI
jgi:protoporphyrin/coproporphyrin ferrochelatase